MSTAAILTPPTHEDLTRKLHALEQAMYLYNPSPEWVIREQGGRPFYLVPDRGGEAIPHPSFKDEHGQPLMVIADGRTGVKTLWGGKKYEKGHATERGALEGQAAWEIVKYFAEFYSFLGIIYLEGSADDAARMKAAKNAYRANVRNWALEQTQARAEFVANWRKQPGNKNSGRMPPPPTTVQLQAQEILDEVGTETRMAATFVCTLCFLYETTDWDKFSRHLAASHNRPNEKREDWDAASAPAAGAPDLDDDEEDDDVTPPAARSGRGKPGKRR
jgi:hypothetical protein